MANLEKAKEVLKDGGIILYPTDTIWGIGCDATNPNAVQKIIDLKKRTDDKSFIVLVNSFHMLEKHIPEFPDVCYDLIDMSEKPLTIIYDKPKGIALNVVAADNSVGIRLTKDSICSNLIQSLRKPIVSTSANLTGSKSPTCFSEISDAIKKGVDYIVEERLDEVCKKPSSIIKIGANSSVKVIR